MTHVEIMMKKLILVVLVMGLPPSTSVQAHHSFSQFDRGFQVVVTAEVPGVNPEDIDISIEGETLTISGSRSEEALPEGAEYRRRERSYGEFTRSIELPFRIDAGSVEANFTNGVLNINLPRLPEEKPRKITVNVG